MKDTFEGEIYFLMHDDFQASNNVGKSENCLPFVQIYTRWKRPEQIVSQVFPFPSIPSNSK